MELHFQSSDISVSGNLLILNPYRFFSDLLYLCGLERPSRARRAKADLRLFLWRVLTKRRGVRNFPPPSFPPCGKRSAVRGADTQIRHTCVCDDGRGDGAFGAAATLPPGCDRRSRSVSVTTRDRWSQQGLFFTQPLKAAQELFHRGRRRDMRGGDFVSVLRRQRPAPAVKTDGLEWRAAIWAFRCFNTTCMHVVQPNVQI